ncbi:ATP-binding cassette domain-containing protein [Sinorhizobium psoraleae]|uniref:ATP-binding cassette domain-containing protein n=1 Tax=Sinorhizobium psoraleae TaxID=520838 RepID=A0ABT4KP68_9HYPH|nr:ATP-binding cassette domain-containing protein [Sinorhizobium psoraleae]MCZ4093704.1 ATP-binding cassette domain-containing protein [Sinorhizobium psoraleae]
MVGESGCGKTTVARLLMRLVDPTHGRGSSMGSMLPASARPLRDFRRKMQMVFQDPYSSLNPRLTAGQIVTEPVENFERLSGQQRDALAADLLRKVRLAPETKDIGFHRNSQVVSGSGSASPARWPSSHQSSLPMRPFQP